MLENLDKVAWGEFQHAYGAASDVPILLRKLATGEDSLERESPLWQLFGNIWHQGTVYEATSYAVPFLVELAAGNATPDRPGILALLGAIAQGHSGRYADKCRAAILAVYDKLESIAAVDYTELALGAAHVMAQFPEHSEKVGAIVFRALEMELSEEQRAGYTLLLGQVGNRSNESVQMLLSALCGESKVIRLVATAAFAMLNVRELPPDAIEIIRGFDYGVTEDLLSGNFSWDIMAEIDEDEVLEYVEGFAEAE